MRFGKGSRNSPPNWSNSFFSKLIKIRVRIRDPLILMVFFKKLLFDRCDFQVNALFLRGNELVRQWSLSLIFNIYPFHRSYLSVGKYCILNYSYKINKTNYLLDKLLMLCDVNSNLSIIKTRANKNHRKRKFMVSISILWITKPTILENRAHDIIW